jgi:hypothetical protein
VHRVIDSIFNEHLGEIAAAFKRFSQNPLQHIDFDYSGFKEVSLIGVSNSHGRNP